MLELCGQASLWGPHMASVRPWMHLLPAHTVSDIAQCCRWPSLHLTPQPQLTLGLKHKTQPSHAGVRDHEIISMSCCGPLSLKVVLTQTTPCETGITQPLWADHFPKCSSSFFSEGCFSVLLSKRNPFLHSKAPRALLYLPKHSLQSEETHTSIPTCSSHTS